MDVSDDSSLTSWLSEHLRLCEFSLVFEFNRPEDMKLYGKPVYVGPMTSVMCRDIVDMCLDTLQIFLKGRSRGESLRKSQ